MWHIYFFAIYIYQTTHKILKWIHIYKYIQYIMVHHSHDKKWFSIHMYLSLKFTCPNKIKKKNQRTNFGRVDNKTQLFLKIISTSSCRLNDFNKRISIHIIYYYSSAPTNESLRSSHLPTAQYKIYKGEFIVKEINKHRMTIINKKTITITIIILNNPLVQHILNN